MKDKPKSYPNALQSLGITIIVMALLYVLQFPLRSMHTILDAEVAMFLYYTLAMGISLWILLTLSRIQGDRKAFDYKIGDLKTPLLIIIATLALLIGLIYPLSFLIPISESGKAMFKAALSSTGIFTFMAIVVAAPIFEEYIFRGIMLDGLLKNYSTPVAILISSIFFGIFHVNPLQIISAFIGGIFLGWIYYKTRKIIYCMLIHFVVNLSGFLILKEIGINHLLEMSFLETYGNSYGIALSTIIIANLIFLVCLLNLKNPHNHITT